MDFYTLSRKELQALCKKNKIPANITNLAMADALAALAALDKVEGLDEFLNSRVIDADKNGIQDKPSAVANTPAAAPVSRRRATGRSVCAKIETAGGTSVQRAYSTRRSIRLLGKDLSKMSLVDTEDNGLVKIHDDAGSTVEAENKESIGVMQDILPSEASEEDTLVEVTEQDPATLTVVVPGGVAVNLESEAQAYKSDEPVGGEDIVLDAEKLESDAQAEESVEPVGGENIVLDADNAFSSILDVEAGDYMNSSENMEADAKAEESEEPAAGEDDLEAEAKAEASEEPEACEDDLEEVDNAFSSGDVVSGNIVIPNQIMTEDSTNKQQIIDIPDQLVPSDQLKGDVHNSNMKENVTSNDLHNRSLRQLKKMMRELNLDGKSNCKTNDVKEVEKKRTALQVLPQNRITADEAQIDG